MDAKNRWWVAELFAKDCEKTRKLYDSLEKDEKRKNGGDASTKGGEDNKKCRRECWTSAQNHEANTMEGRAQILEKVEEDARLLDRCEAKRKEWSTDWQCDEEVQNMQDKPWRNKELRRCEEALPRLKEGDLEKASRLNMAKTVVR